MSTEAVLCKEIVLTSVTVYVKRSVISRAESRILDFSVTAVRAKFVCLVALFIRHTAVPACASRASRRAIAVNSIVAVFVSAVALLAEFSLNVSVTAFREFALVRTGVGVYLVFVVT